MDKKLKQDIDEIATDLTNKYFLQPCLVAILIILVFAGLLLHTNSCSFKKGMEAEKKILNDLNMIKK